MHFFGLMGSLMFFLGFVAICIVIGLKIHALYTVGTSMLLGQNAYFQVSMLMMILGTMLFLAGFIGELVLRNSESRNDYQVKATI